MLSIRKRGKYFHVRGSIRVGRETRIIKEHSSGSDRRDVADAYRSKLETDIRHEILHGRGGRTHTLTIADAGLRYMGRPGGVRSYDVWRIGQINAVIGDWTIANAGGAWSEYKRVRCAGLAPATVQRHRSTYSAAINYLAEAEGFDPPKLPRGEKVNNQRIRWLIHEQADRMIKSYAEHAQPIATTLRWQGLRIGEALRMEWVHVRWAKNAIFIAESKSGVARTVTMHRRTRAALHRLWVSRGSPKEGHVFLAPLVLPRRPGDVDWIEWSAVDWNARTLEVQNTERGRRVIALLPKTFNRLRRCWQSAGEPARGRIARDRIAAPYADTRKYKFPSGSPIKKTHATACRRAGISDFTVHDWRHHWACWCVMAGIDLETLKQEGGWKSLRMVERYATVSADHRVTAMKKLK